MDESWDDNAVKYGNIFYEMCHKRLYDTQCTIIANMEIDLMKYMVYKMKIMTQYEVKMRE